MAGEHIYFYKDLYHEGKFFYRKPNEPSDKVRKISDDKTNKSKTHLEDFNSKSSEKVEEKTHAEIVNVEIGSDMADEIMNTPMQSTALSHETEEKRKLSSIAATNKKNEDDDDVDELEASDGQQTRLSEDNVAKRLIRDLFVYILFVICAGAIQFSMSSRSAVYFTNTIDAAFMDTPYVRPVVFPDGQPLSDEKGYSSLSNESLCARPEGEVAVGGAKSSTQTLKKSKTIEDFWNFAETTFLNMMFWQFWYSYENPIFPALPEDQLIFYASKLIGVSRVRQLRVRGDSCEIHAQASHLFDVCYGYFNGDGEDTAPLMDINPVEYTGTGWRHSKLENTLSYSGKFSTYSGDGYYVDMSLNRSLSELRVKELKSNVWIDRGTRAVIIDFTLYNTNVNLFLVTKIVIEFPPTGGIYPTGEFYTLKFLRYVSVQDFVVLGYEFAFIFFILYYVISGFFLIKNAGGKYFSDIWNILDIIIILFGIAVVMCGLYRYIVIELNVTESLKLREEHAAFDHARYFQIIFNNMSTTLLFFIWIKLFKYLQFNPTINELNKTLARSTRSILSFTIMFCTIFFAFAQFAYLIFGTEVEDYRTVWSSAMSLLQALLGKLNYRELEESNFILGPLFLILFVFFIFFVLMNMFGAIIIESYQTVRSEVTPANERLVATYFIKAFSNILPASKNKSKDSDASITYSKMRDALHRAGFTNMEMDVFFAKYNIQTNFDVTQSEAKKLIAKLELRKFDFDPINLNAQTVADLQREFEKMKAYVEDLVKKVEVQNQQLKSHYLENPKACSTQTPA